VFPLTLTKLGLESIDYATGKCYHYIRTYVWEVFIIAKKLFSQKQFVLLTESDIYGQASQDNPWLKDIFEQHYDITDAQMNELEETQRNFFKNSFHKIMEQAEAEWVGVNNICEDLGSERISCSLCSTPNKYVFYIENKLNGNRLNVGSECIKEFADVLKIFGVSRSKLLNDAKKIKRLNDIEQKTPGISRIVQNWYRQIDEFPIVIPIKVERPYINLGEKINRVYSNYIEGNQEIEDIYPELTNLLHERESIIRQLNEYVDKNKSKKYVADKKIVNWVTNNPRDKVTIDLLKEDGFIEHRTSFRILEPNFMMIILNDFETIGKSRGIDFIKADSNKNGYIINCHPHKSINLLCNHRDLLINYGDLIFSTTPVSNLNAENILKICRVYDDKSMDLYIDEFADMLKGSDVAVFEHDNHYDTLSIFEKKTNSLVMLNLSEFINNNLDCIYLLNSNSINSIMEYIRSRNEKRYNRDDYEQMIERRYTNKEELKGIRSLRRKI